MPTCTASSSASRSNTGCGASATAQSSAIRARHTGEPGCYGEFHRRREVLLRIGAPPEQRGQIAAQPVGGSEVHREAHLHRLVRKGVELAVQHVSPLAVGQRRAHLGEVGESFPARWRTRGTAAKPSDESVPNSRRASSNMPTSAKSAVRPGRHTA